MCHILPWTRYSTYAHGDKCVEWIPDRVEVGRVGNVELGAVHEVHVLVQDQAGLAQAVQQPAVLDPVAQATELLHGI